jgi:glyoxylase-like metal-dependent hydrolase (beta-lactamase superfamily II)
MKTLAVGDLQIDAIVEDPSWPMSFEHMFPDVTAEMLTRERSWLEPRFARMDAKATRAGSMAFLAFHSYLVRTPRHIILVDSCIGNDKDRGGFEAFHMRRTPFLWNLAQAGITPGQVDYVMCTHMHADHVGWNTRLVDGRWVPTFPNAKYVFGRVEYENRRRNFENNGPNKMSGFADSVLPVVEAGQAVMVDSDFALDDTAILEPAPGHTPGNVIIHLRSRGNAAVLSGDVIHHPIQVVYPECSPVFCEDRAESARYRQKFVQRFADRPELILPAHFSDPSAGHIVTRGSRWAFAFV